MSLNIGIYLSIFLYIYIYSFFNSQTSLQPSTNVNWWNSCRSTDLFDVFSFWRRWRSHAEIPLTCRVFFEMHRFPSQQASKNGSRMKVNRSENHFQDPPGSPASRHSLEINCFWSLNEVKKQIVIDVHFSISFTSEDEISFVSSHSMLLYHYCLWLNR